MNEEIDWEQIERSVVAATFAAMEFGYKACERGWNWEMTQVEFHKRRIASDLAPAGKKS